MSNLHYLVPRPIRKVLFNVIKRELIDHRETVEKEIPKINLKPEHIAHSQLVIDRCELLRKLPKNGIVAEIGVDEGNFSHEIISNCRPAKLHLIDLWSTERYGQLKKEKVENKFQDEISNRRIEINLGESTKVARSFPDSYFDWVYIDTSHSYETTFAELKEYQKKIKKNGIIAGHDYVRWSRTGFTRYGVIEAVSEFCCNFNWEIIYLTVESDDNPSFAIKKMPSSNRVYYEVNQSQ